MLLFRHIVKTTLRSTPQSMKIKRIQQLIDKVSVKVLTKLIKINEQFFHKLVELKISHIYVKKKK